MRTPDLVRSCCQSLLLAVALFSAAASAAPAGGQLMAGQASIASAPGLTTINQTSPAAVINWQQFNIGAQERVVFQQPSADSTTLNRVVGGSAAQILGSLTANGRVFLLDPQGVMFGRDAVVDVGGLLASTLAIRDDDFLAGRYGFTSAEAAGGQVSNAGALVARDGGFVVLAGNNVANTGLVQARLGHIVMAAGSALTLDFNGDGLLSYVITQSAAAAQINNSGRLLADGGVIALTASNAGAVVGSVVNNSGLVQARSIERRSGSIFLRGSGGDVTNSGGLDVSAVDGTPAGNIVAVADRDLLLTPSSSIDARDTSGSGHAGSVELSGHGQLRVRGGLSIGRGGHLLLDPANLLIADGSGTDTATTMYAQNLVTQLQAGTDVGLDADHNITFGHLSAPLDGRNNGGGGGLSAFLNDGSGSGDGIFFSDTANSILVDGALFFNSAAGAINVGTLSAANINVIAGAAAATGALTATHGSIFVKSTVGDVITGSMRATDITTDSSAADADITVFAGDALAINGGVSTDAEVHAGAAVCSANCGSANGRIGLHSNLNFTNGTTALTVSGTIDARAVSGGTYVAEVDDSQGNLVTPSQGDASAAVTVSHHDPFSGAPSVGNVATHAIQAAAVASAGDSAMDASVTVNDDGGGTLDTRGGAIVAGGFDSNGPALPNAGSITLSSGRGLLAAGPLTATNSGIHITNGDLGGGNSAADTQVILGAVSGGVNAQQQAYPLREVQVLSGGSLAIAGSLSADDINLTIGDGTFTAGALIATAGRVAIDANSNVVLNAVPIARGCGDARGCVFIDTENLLLQNAGALDVNAINFNVDPNVDVFHALLTLRSGGALTVSNSNLMAGTTVIDGGGAVTLDGSAFNGESFHLNSGGAVVLRNTSLTDFSDVTLAAAGDLTFDGSILGFGPSTPHAGYYTLVARAGTGGTGNLTLSNGTQLSNGSVLLEAAGDIADDGQPGGKIDTNALGVGSSGNINLAATQLLVGRGAAPIGGDPEMVELQQEQRQQRTNTLDQEGFAPVASFIGRSVTLGPLSLQGTFVAPPPADEGGPYGHYLYFQADALTLLQNVDAPTDALVQFVPFTQGASIGIEQVQSNHRMVNFGVDTQLSKFPGTTFAFGSSSYNGNIYSGEDAPVNVTSQGSGAENFVFLSSGSVNGKDNIFTNGEVVVLQAPDDFEIPLFNQFQPGADRDEGDSAETSGGKKGEGGTAKAVRVRLPRGSVVRRTRLGAKECH